MSRTLEVISPTEMDRRVNLLCKADRERRRRTLEGLGRTPGGFLDVRLRLEFSLPRTLLPDRQEAIDEAVERAERQLRAEISRLLASIC